MEVLSDIILRLFGCLERLRVSRKMILVIVFCALLLDNILLTVVVPIVPSYLFVVDHGDAGIQGTDADTHISFNGTHQAIYTTIQNQSRSSNFTFSFVQQEDFSSENSKVGWLYSSKATVQLVANPIVGYITTRYGNSIPMVAGSFILFISATMYALGESYVMLLLARSVQGFGSSCTAIAGMTLLAETYTEDKERSRAMGIALGGLALGVLLGYPFGGLMYQFVGKMAPFWVIAGLVVLVVVLQIWVLKPSVKTEKTVEGTPLLTLLKDKYILIAAGAILFPEMAMAMLEPTLPIWLLDNVHPEKWQLGTIFLPDSIGYLVGCNVFGVLAHRFGRWLCSIIGLVMLGLCLLCIPLATNVVHLLVPHFGIGLALGMVDVSILSLLALLVDTRHVAVYGSVYAIAQVSISLGFALGPSLGGQLVKLLGFPWLVRGMALANILYSPLCYFLRHPPPLEENKSILLSSDGHRAYTSESTVSYGKLQED